MLANTLSRFAPSAHNIQSQGIGFAAEVAKIAR